MTIQSETLPLVSVLIPCYNAELYVEQAVRSILDQSYKNLEIIVINDCSTDNTGLILEKLAAEDSRIKYIINPKNLKLIDTLNKGLLLCTGKYIARMDADDISHKNRIKIQVNFLELHPEISIVGTGIQVFGDGIPKKKLFNPSNHNDIIAKLFTACPLFHPTVMFKSSLTKTNYFNYDLNFFRAEDYHLWVKLAINNIKFSNIPKILLDYRILPNSETKLAEKNITERIEKHFQIYKLLLSHSNIKIESSDLMIYTKTMSKNWINQTIPIQSVSEIYKKVIGQSKNKMIKYHLSIRWIIFLMITKKFTNLSNIKEIFSPLTISGLYNVILTKIRTYSR